MIKELETLVGVTIEPGLRLAKDWFWSRNDGSLLTAIGKLDFDSIAHNVGVYSLNNKLQAMKHRAFNRLNIVKLFAILRNQMGKVSFNLGNSRL